MFNGKGREQTTRINRVDRKNLTFRKPFVVRDDMYLECLEEPNNKK